MRKRTLLERIVELPEVGEGEHTPPAELVAFTICVSRGLSGWKQSTLAEFSGVSLSTVERAERGEVVRPEALDRIAIALGFDAGYFTAPRRRLTTEETLKVTSDRYRHLIPVDVEPVSTQPKVRELAESHAFLLHCPEQDDTLAPLLHELAEWLDLGSYLFSKMRPLSGDNVRGRRREYYSSVLDCVRRIQGTGQTVLGGVVTDTLVDGLKWKVALITVTPRATDPGALKRRSVLVDRRHWADPLGECKDASK